MSVREADGEVSRSGVAEWEEPRHPGTASLTESTPHRPTLQHGTRTASHNVVVLARRPLKSGAICGMFRSGTDSCSSMPFLHGCVQRRDLHASLRFEALPGPRGGRSGRNWAQRVVSASISAAATSSSTAGTSSSATTSWIFGAARAACSERRAAASERASAAWAASAPAERGAVALGALERGDERRRSRARGSAARGRERPVGGLAQRRARGGAPELGASTPGWRRPTSASARAGRGPAAIATRSRSSTSGSSASIARASRARATAPARTGGEEAGDGGGEERRERRAGRARPGERERRERASSARPALSATISPVGRRGRPRRCASARPPAG